jgi:hypothetical protein
MPVSFHPSGTGSEHPPAVDGRRSSGGHPGACHYHDGDQRLPLRALRQQQTARAAMMEHRHDILEVVTVIGVLAAGRRRARRQSSSVAGISYLLFRVGQEDREPG